MMDKLLDDALKICVQVGEELVARSREISIHYKGKDDLVTDADHWSEERLISELRKILPESSFVSEEMKNLDDNQINDYVWVIDPIDGTVNYATQVPFYAISVALLKNGRQELAVVHAPALNETFTAIRGQGAYLSGKKLDAGRSNDNLLKTIATSTGISYSDFIQKKTAYYEKLSPHFQRLKLMGSQALHLCYVAAARIDVAITNKAKIWDDAAASLILEEAGGCYADFQGKEIFPLLTDSSLYRGAGYESVGSATKANLDLFVSAIAS